MPHLTTLPHFLDPETCRSVLNAVRKASAEAATVSGGRHGGYAVESTVRRTRRIVPPDEIRALIVERLVARQDELAAHYGVALVECEEPQFLRYESGDFFVAHQDGNTPLIHDHTRFRKVSIVVFLNERTEYTGGELVLHGAYPQIDLRHTIEPAPGMLVAFPSQTTHEVLPVRSGERYTIATWFRSAQ